MFVLMIIVFVIGYACIALEHKLKIDKAATALMLGALMWILFVIGKQSILNDPDITNKSWDEYCAANPNAPHDDSFLNTFIIQEQSLHHLGETSETLFFLLGAMTIVAIIDKHNGFSIITNKITTRNKMKLLWMLSI